MTTFAQAWPGARAHLDRIFGGSVKIVPMIVSQRLGARPDPARAEVEIRAKFTLGPGIEDFQGSRSGSPGQGFGTRQVAEAQVSISAAVWSSLPYEPGQGDEVVITSEPGQPRYSIARVIPSHLGQRVLDLVTELQQ
jgi:hypothetical protein